MHQEQHVNKYIIFLYTAILQPHGNHRTTILLYKLIILFILKKIGDNINNYIHLSCYSF